MVKELDSIMKPKSIAVIGASTKEHTIGSDIMKRLQEYKFTGKIYPVNPKGGIIEGLQAYTSVLEIPESIDLALIVANPTIESVKLAKRIAEFSIKHASGGQLGVIVNKVNDQDLDKVYKTMKEAELDILGSIPYDANLASGTSDWNSEIVTDAVKQFYSRLNLPQENNL